MPKRRTYKKKGGFKKAVKKVVSDMAETKTYLYTFNNVVSDSGTLLHLTDISQGDTQSTRDGNQIFLKGITVRMHSILADTYNIMRIIIVRARTGAGDVTSADFPAGVSPDPFIEEMNYDKYTVVKDQVITLDAGKVHDVRKFYIKVNKKIQYGSNTSSDVVTNPYYIWLVSDSDISSHPSVALTARMYWKDF